MKKLILSGLMMLFVMSIFAQKNTDRSAESDTQALVEKYNLTDAQEAKVLKIQNRKYNHAAQFADLENTNTEQFLAKKSANEEQTNFSIVRLLDKDQRILFKQNKRDLRARRGALSHKMLKEGATPIEIKKALLELE